MTDSTTGNSPTSAKVFDIRTRLEERIQRADAPKRPERMTVALALAAPVTGKTHLVRCGVQPGFFLQVTAKGFKSWGVEAKVKNGKQRTVIIGPFANGKGVPIKVAEQEARRLHTDATVHGIDIAKAKRRQSDGETLDEAHAEFLAFPRTRPLRPASQKLYAFQFRLLKATLPTGNMLAYTKADVKAAYLNIVKLSAKSKRAQCTENVNTPGTVSGYGVMTYLTTLWNFLNLERETTDIPCPTSALHGMMKAPQRRKVFIRDNQFSEWWNTLELIEVRKDLQSTVAVFALYFRMAVLLATRRTELLLLKWSEVLDLDSQKPSILIPGSRTKNHLEHHIPVGPWLAKVLRAHKKSQKVIDHDTGKATGTEWVFAYPPDTYSAGLPLSHESVTRTLEKHRALLSWKHNAHDTRRTYINVATKKLKIHDSIIKKLVNHTDKSDQTEQYRELEVEDLRESQDKIEAQMLKLAKGELSV